MVKHVSILYDQRTIKPKEKTILTNQSKRRQYVYAMFEYMHHLEMRVSDTRRCEERRIAQENFLRFELVNVLQYGSPLQPNDLDSRVRVPIDGSTCDLLNKQFMH